MLTAAGSGQGRAWSQGSVVVAAGPAAGAARDRQQLAGRGTQAAAENRRRAGFRESKWGARKQQSPRAAWPPCTTPHHQHHPAPVMLPCHAPVHSSHVCRFSRPVSLSTQRSRQRSWMPVVQRQRSAMRPPAIQGGVAAHSSVGGWSGATWQRQRRQRRQGRHALRAQPKHPARGRQCPNTAGRLASRLQHPLSRSWKRPPPSPLPVPAGSSSVAEEWAAAAAAAAAGPSGASRVARRGLRSTHLLLEATRRQRGAALGHSGSGVLGVRSRAPRTGVLPLLEITARCPGKRGSPASAEVQRAPSPLLQQQRVHRKQGIGAMGSWGGGAWLLGSPGAQPGAGAAARRSATAAGSSLHVRCGPSPAQLLMCLRRTSLPVSGLHLAALAAGSRELPATLHRSCSLPARRMLLRQLDATNALLLR